MNELVDRLYDVSKQNAAANDSWGAICAVVYADIMVLEEVFSSAPLEATLDGSIVATTPKPEGDSAAALVEAMRQIITQGVEEEYREQVTSLLIPIDHLANLPAPYDTEALGAILLERTEGHKAHAFKAVKNSDARIHARAAASMSQAGMDKQEVRNAVRASDLAIFEVKSIEYSLTHADWQLDGHAVRLAMAKRDIETLTSGSRHAFRAVLVRQFDGLDAVTDLPWVIQ